jgi:ABC-type transport system involved in multi-copper enzyme maturation permease subunit
MSSERTIPTHMTTAGLLSLAQVLPRAAGPLFARELRIASRRRRYYVLRGAYVCLLMFVVLQLWLVVVRVGSGGSAVVQAARLAEAGKSIAATLIWVQFVVGQILAAVLLSDAISDEIRRQTLETLLVTPLGGLHIVAGKLLSRLFQLILLLAASLPLLAVVRVFGGVPWDYVLSGCCITLTSAAFAGSLSLFSSVRHRHAYEAVVLVGFWYLVVWGLLSGALMFLSRAGYVPGNVGKSVLFLTNPWVALMTQTQTLLGGPGGPGGFLSWPLHCLIVLAAAGAFLALSIRRVRSIVRAGESRHTAQASRTGLRRWRWGLRRAEQPIRRVQGPPVQWKEGRTPLFRARRHLLFDMGLWTLVAGLVLVVILFVGAPVYGSFFLPIQILQLVLVIRLAVAAGGGITREKEARTWPILLTTPLSNRQIIEGKARGALRQNLFLLVLLLGLHLPIVVLGPAGQPAVIFLVVLSLAAMVLFLLGVGLYLSTRLRTTTGAVAATLGLYFVPNLFCCGGFGSALLLSAGVAAHGGLAALFVISVIPMIAYMVVGLLGLRGATQRLRRNVF